MENDEAASLLCELFPDVSIEESKNYLIWNTFDQAIDLLSQIYPQDENDDHENDEQENETHPNDEIPNRNNPDHGNSPNIGRNENRNILFEKSDDSDNDMDQNCINLLIIEMKESFPDLDDEICLLILEESNFIIQKAKKTADATQRLYQHYLSTSENEEKLQKLKNYYPNVNDETLRNCLEAAGGDFQSAVGFVESTFPRDSQISHKKAKPTKTVISESGPTSFIRQTKKEPKKKKKAIPSIKESQSTKTSAVSSIPPEYQVNQTMKMENNVNLLMSMFENAFSKEEIEEVLNLTENDIDRSANMLAEKLATHNLNTHDEQIDPHIKELTEIFPLASFSEIELALNDANKDIETASLLLMNRFSENPMPEDTLLAQRPDLSVQEAKEVLQKTNGNLGEASKIFWHIQKKPIQRNSSSMTRKLTRTVDLHGLRLAEAQDVVSRSLRSAKDSNTGRICFITGHGAHSKNHIPVLKPLVFRMCKDFGYKPIQSRNRGIIVCNIV
ncbi:hypothetical protein TRFO_03164 [Tritrichomonas foetus]|uniref:Smr domain-containing protein n=1 Tax=Tritrichomonas foetus TaxID=1144522 RepID=A0A1J4KSQ0_9EUKA|nr:hypothetical protein TRFO_03164 [Tritrichomonas foetus]|eukprot:OHT14130.1 hypothetical protein TRFO_03164 [Tritrichomonas foetus]